MILLAMVIAASAHGRQRVRPGSAPGMIMLPYNATDSAGNQWLVYQGGFLQQRGNQPIFSQAATLNVNGNGVQSNANPQQAKLDEKTNEVVFENLNAGGVATVTRRVFVNVPDGYVRYIDVLRNPQPQEQSFNVMVQSNLNYGVASAQNITEPAGKQRPIGWAAMTPAGRAAVELFAGKSAKTVPTINYQPGNSFVQASMTLTVPPGKEVAIMHVHATAASAEAGTQTLLSLRESDLLKGVPNDLRKLITNFSVGSGFIGDREILRGDLLDVIELRGGDLLRGTIKESTLKLETFYAPIELQMDKVVALLNVGQYRPRQLVVTVDGEIFGGKLGKETIDLELSSGQVTQVPLSQLSRVGWRKRPGESDDKDALNNTEKPFVLLRTGDKMAIEAPTTLIDVNTRYGLLKVNPQSIAAVTFAAEDSGVHEITLTDGSHFSGLVAADHFNFKLAGGAGGQTVSFTTSSLARLQLTAKIEEPDDSSPTLELANDDLFVGTLAGQLKLDTAFDTITLNAPELRQLARPKDAVGLDVQVELWDQTRMSGQLQQQQLTCALASGLQVTVPVPLVTRYAQPLPQPSAAMVERIKTIVQQLGADDWKDRERAETQLVNMGPSVMGVLKQLRPDVGPEAQQRIDSILKQLEKKKGTNAPAAAAPIDQ